MHLDLKLSVEGVDDEVDGGEVGIRDDIGCGGE